MARKSPYLTFMEGLQGALEPIRKREASFLVAWGPCEYFIHKALSAIRTVWKTIDSSPPTQWEGEEFPKEKLLEIWEQKSLFENATLHIIKRVKKQSEYAKWLAQVTSQKQNIVLLTLETNKISTSLAKEMKRLGATEILCQNPFANDLPTMATQLAKKRQIKLEPHALNLLLKVAGEDIYFLENEIDRLALIFHQQETITIDQLRPVMSTVSQAEAFKLSSLLLNHQISTAQVFLDHLLEQGESPLAIVGILVWHLRNALKPQTAKLPYSLTKGYNRYVKETSKSKLIKALSECQKADVILKSSRVSPSLAISPILMALS
ncbi:MAG: DNA polymerase III subunit delta [Deltaproteobacteria bacterium]|nr:DNA polymerase III subunit delta [Deltaproteobacteria bacterium]